MSAQLTLAGFLLAWVGPGALPSPALAQKTSNDVLVTVEVAHVGVGLVTRVPVVILQDPSSNKTMPVWVGTAEAEAIARALFGIKPRRPMTHDLLADMIRALGATVEEVRIIDSRDDVYYGEVRLRSQGKTIDVDSRPSDAVALALRTKAPIRVVKRLLDVAPEVEVRPDENATDLSRALGLTVVTPTEDVRKVFNLPHKDGVTVVEADGEGAEAGLRRGDLIIRVNDRTPKTAEAFWETVRAAPVGKPVQIEYWRDGKQRQTSVTPRRPEGRPATGSVPA